MNTDQILRGEPRAVARAASAIENATPEGVALLTELAPHAGKALLIGLTGPPGAGKSTLCDQLVRSIRAEGKKVAVIAIDPSSPISGGAILGDRVRMQEHHADPGVFIRSMATRGWPGGLAKTTRDVATLLDASGFDVVIIETVGVGQSEIEVARLAQVTVLVLTPSSGDGIQTMKAGIMEVAQVFAVNKADLPGADQLAHELHAETEREVVKVIALEGQGVAELLAAIRNAPRRVL
jgi:LAO/AO transport system kinase